MTFKELKQGYPVHILDKDMLIVKQGKVQNTSFPRVDTMQGQRQMVVDVTVECDGKTATYTMPEDSCLVYASNLVISTETQGLIVEVEKMKNEAEQILSSVDHQKEVVEVADELLAKLNPAFKEKRETEQRFQQIEGRMNGVDDKLDKLINMIQTRTSV